MKIEQSVRVLDDWILLPERIALHAPSRVAVLADLHLGYSARRRSLGDAVPLPTLESILAPLRRAAESWPIEKILIAGDLFERGYDAELFEAFLELLKKWNLTFTGLVPGNHDRIQEPTPIQLLPTGYELGGWKIVHGDQLVSGRVVMGHWHPAVRFGGRKVPCFLVGTDHLILPAFSADAAGCEIQQIPLGPGSQIYALLSEGVQQFEL